MWLNPSGNDILAEQFVEPVTDLILNDPKRGNLAVRGATRSKGDAWRDGFKRD